ILEYQKAANAKDSLAQYNLVLYYDNRRGITKDSEKAFELYSKAAEVGYLNAQYNLAVCYDNREETTRNSEKAFELSYHQNQLETTEDLKKVGNPNPQTSIGTYHRKGWEIVKILEETFQFYLKTAETGNQTAQYNLR
ncbi:hypothetical protein G9A89_012458, partial [Geosiphon pyriformis]